MICDVTRMCLIMGCLGRLALGNQIPITPQVTFLSPDRRLSREVKCNLPPLVFSLPPPLMCQHSDSLAVTAAASGGREILPKNVKPVHYAVSLEPFFDSFTFAGEEEIEFLVLNDTDFILLNVLDIEIQHASIDGTDIEKLSISYDKEYQSVTFKLPKSFSKGDTPKLFLKFTGELNDKMAGFYRSSYQENGVTKYLATTQMEATDCRRAFPCYDEPSAKAKFSISVIADPLLVVLSNMDLKETIDVDGGKTRSVFHTTPVMSTYLVAFIVGDLKCVETHSFRLPIKVWATPGSEHLGTYSAEIAAKTLAFFESKFDIPYPLPKLDMVAIHDFAAGAMENFGLVTYRTVDLLLDPEHTNINTKQRVTEVVMHELAHQWFGNLVTMDFWDGLWLNEGFATWMSWYACNSLYPEWKVWESYVSDTLQSALALDALRSSHPIEVPVKRIDEISQIFDAISYSKGSSLLKMISKWLGEDTFIKGVSNYLKKHKWGNTQTLDLWAALGDASGKDVIGVMNIWTREIGYPVLTVTEESDKLVRVTQNRFLATGDATKDEDKVIYPIFLGIKTLKGIDETALLNTRSEKIQLSTDEFFKLNADQAGIYRTAYSDERWSKLGAAGVEGKLSVEDRAGLVADAGALSAAGYIKTTSFLNLTKSWTREANYVVWEQILNNVASVRAALLFENSAIRDGLDAFVLDLIDEKLSEIGWEFSKLDSFQEAQLKSLLFGAAVKSGHQKASKFALDAFEKFVAGHHHAIHPNLRTFIFHHAAKKGDKKTFDSLFKIYSNPSAVEEKIAALSALGSFRDHELIDKLCAMLLDSSIIKEQDIYIPMTGLRNHQDGVVKLWAWTTRNWDKITEKISPTSSMLGHVVSLSAGGFTKEEQKQQVIEFFELRSTKGFNQALQQCLDSVTAKIQRANRDTDVVADWLRKNDYQ